MKSVATTARSVLFKRHKILGRREYKLLRSLLQPDEFIKHTVWGLYQGGSGLIAMTNKRVFLLDKRPFFDYIQQSDSDKVEHSSFASGFMAGVLSLKMNKNKFEFHSFSDAKLKQIHSEIIQRLEDSKRSLPMDLQQKQIIRPLYRRIKKHPAWVPHNPVMMKVLESAGAVRKHSLDTLGRNN